MTFVDLFCGAGGLSCGLEQSGFKPILANELDPIFASSYSTNHPGVPVLVGDIREVDLISQIECINNVDMVVGGPPCQGYSIVAPQRRVDDPRNHLFKEFLKVVEYIKPKAIIIENVPGIVSFEKGLIVNQVYEMFNRMGYRIEHMILCAAHYGVPQIRFRTFFIGILNRKRQIYFPYPTHRAKVHQNFTNSKDLCFNLGPLQEFALKPHTGIMEAIGDLPKICDGEYNTELEYIKEPTTPFQIYAREGCATLTSHCCAQLSPINKERLKYIPCGGSWRDIPFDLLPKGLQRARRSDHTKRYGRLVPDGLCSTIQTKCDPHWGCFFHPTQDRVISIREAARIQSFPDRIMFKGNMTQQYKQVGNAVPPLMAKHVGECVKRMLEEE